MKQLALILGILFGWLVLIYWVATASLLTGFILVIVSVVALIIAEFKRTKE